MESRSGDISLARELAAAVVKCMVIVLPALLLPGFFPNRVEGVFALSLVGGYIAQHFIPPRGEHFWALLAVAVFLVLARGVLLK